MDSWTVLIWIASAFICYGLAKNKNRNPSVAAGLGILFGVFAIVGYLLIGKKNGKKE